MASQLQPGCLSCVQRHLALLPAVSSAHPDTAGACPHAFSQVLRKSRPPPQQQKILLHDVACALSQLHSMGLVQMDIRPANVMFFGWVPWRRAWLLSWLPSAWATPGGCPTSCTAHTPLRPRPHPRHTLPTFPARSKEGAWKLVDFENWAWAGQPADVSYALRYTAPEVRAWAAACLVWPEGCCSSPVSCCA